MEYSILSNSFWDFLEKNVAARPSDLALVWSQKSLDFDLQFALNQITARQKTQHKLPIWLAQQTILFPSILAAQQASSERTALYKANEFCKKTNMTCLDLSGGLGVDAWAFAQKAEKMVYVEQNPELVQAARHNFEILGIKNCTIHEADSTVFLEKYHEKTDLIFIDPYRRDALGKKVFRLSDCSPNVSEFMSILQEKADFLLLKNAPLLDAYQAYIDLGGFSELHIVAVQNEVKELLIYKDLHKNYPSEVSYIIKVVDFEKNDIETAFSFALAEETMAEASFAPPSKFLYEPSAALLKAGVFKVLCERFPVGKLHPNSHLYTSENLIPNFPGRSFKVLHIVKYNRKALQTVFSGKKANITCRNFPDSVDKVRKKLKLSDGGDFYIFCTTVLGGGLVLVLCQQLKG